MKFIYLILLISLMSFPAQSQNIQGIINQYYTYTGIQTCNQHMSLAEVHTLSKGDTILIIQMKGADISTAANSTFGNLTDIKGAGLY